MTGSGRWLQGLVALVLTVPAVSAAHFPSCESGEFSNSTDYGSPVWRAAALVTPPAPPELIVQRHSERGPLLSRLDASGRIRWGPVAAAGGFSGLLLGEGGRTIVEVADGGSCGAVVVRRRAAATGRLQWTAKVPGLATWRRPDVTVRTTGLGDVNGDGFSDVPLVRTAQDGGGGVTHCIGQPSGVCRAPGASWSSRLDVLDGRTGHVLITSALGEGRGGMPSAHWVRRGRGDALAVVVPKDAAVAEVTVFQDAKAAWRRELTAAGSDVSLAAGGGTLVAVASAVGYVDLAVGPVVSALDPATGALRWTRPLGGAGQAVPLGNGDVVTADVASGRLVRLDGRTGGEVWSSLPLGSLRLNPYLVGDVDGGGADDVAVPLYDRTVVVGGERGAELLSIDGGTTFPELFAAPDLTGDRVPDVLVLDDHQAETPVVALYGGRGLPRVWGVPVPLGGSRNAALVEGAGGPTGSVLVHSLYGKRFVLSAATGRVRWSLPADGQ